MSNTVSKINILIIDDNKEIVNVFDKYFTPLGIELSVFTNYETALNKINLKKPFNIIVANTLDSSTLWLNFVKLLKAYCSTKIETIIIGSGSIEDLLYATEVEAKKFFTTPCDYEKIAQFTLGLITSMEINAAKNDKVKLVDGWLYSFNKKTLAKSDKVIQLTKNEFAFLEALIKNKDKIVTYDMLKQAIYKTKNLKTDKLHAIRTLARNIRSKTGSKTIIGTLNKIGYKIKVL
ncbi:MAG: response regulator transcription factor [Arcobacter butzleri]|jgi:DNA-binding response OmpR family regulator|nr:winged helix-turn-helix domain-containing protein [Arcobacteraceae bacterium]MDY0364683.1 winged helix-turn-helix domain-containing protein [Arcobacteraceae bacterium]NLO18101.1 response regulator transcription factor [Aliarcobacter butzleri]